MFSTSKTPFGFLQIRKNKLNFLQKEKFIYIAKITKKSVRREGV